MLINSGYNIDFVGSQNHGERPEDDPDWYDWNCEAYPGWKIPDIANKVKTSLPIYKPDILLVHVGTNGKDWSVKPGQVVDMLDMINEFSVGNNHPMTVFLCKIINRFNKEDPTPKNKSIATAGEAAHISGAIELIKQLKPDVIFLDTELSGETSFHLLELSAGVYIYQLKTDDFIQSKKMILVK